MSKKGNVFEILSGRQKSKCEKMIPGVAAFLD